MQDRIIISLSIGSMLIQNEYSSCDKGYSSEFFQIDAITN